MQLTVCGPKDIVSELKTKKIESLLVSLGPETVDCIDGRLYCDFQTLTVGHRFFMRKRSLFSPTRTLSFPSVIRSSVYQSLSHAPR